MNPTHSAVSNWISRNSRIFLKLFWNQNERVKSYFYFKISESKLFTQNWTQQTKSRFEKWIVSQAAWRGEHFLCTIFLSDALSHTILCILCTPFCPCFSASPCSAYGSYAPFRGVFLSIWSLHCKVTIVLLVSMMMVRLKHAGSHDTFVISSCTSAWRYLKRINLNEYWR